MSGFEPLSPKPGGTGGHFWTIWADWGLVAKFGLGFIGAITLYASIQFYFEDDNQKNSYAAALTSIASIPLDHPILQRQARLLRRGPEYSWRAILWVREGSALKPKIWQAMVRHEGKNFRCLSSEVLDYQKEKAWSLELYEDIAASPVPSP